MLLEEKILRKYIKKSIERVQEQTQRELKEERKLRNIIRRLIREGEEDKPHTSTGINVLRDLLRDTIKQVEMQYKKLTSKQEQRDSFRKHFIKATVNLLSPEFSFFASDKETETLNPEIAASLSTGENITEAADITIDVEDADAPADKSKFIDLGLDKGKQKEEEAKKEEEENPFQAIQGLDKTGRNFSMTAFDNVKEQYLDAFRSLDDDKDRLTFYNYLITNLKLHFDRMDDELGNIETEPTTKEYDEEKSKENGMEQASGTETSPPPETKGEEKSAEEDILGKLEEMLKNESRKKKKTV